MSPFHHQVTNLIAFCHRLPVTWLADDVGLGKTISAGLIVSEQITRSHARFFILLNCPLWCRVDLQHGIVDSHTALN